MADDDEETLPESFWGVARQLRHLRKESLAPLDIAPSHARALGVLLREGPLRLNELSDRLRIAARSATEVVDALQDRGLVERRPDPQDRRATLVAPTGEGTRVGEAIRASNDAEAEAYFSILSETERAELAAILRKLRR
ncbi:MarR family winged helix-turn-helix transcriptional regulator [Kribbella sp. NPDC051620]|uniref:MarR family winged helix-turn-helix transcriptional regulator n=1 Tax=Kribbella sp. NPDC051620 TaxID=3364120 RepID=UPI0037B1A2E9